MKQIALVILFFNIGIFVSSQELMDEEENALIIGRSLINYNTEKFTEIDIHALSAPKSAKESVETLAEYLFKPADNDLEKVRSIFRWITDNIAYDTNAYFSGRYGNLTAEGVLRSGKSVCSGYSALFQSLCEIAEIEAVSIQGYAKRYYYKPNHVYSRTTHAWNAVKLNEEWYFIDSTWGAGSLIGKKFKKRYKEFWFLTAPEAAIFSHLPENPKWQLMEEPIDMERFREIPYLGDYFFSMGFSLENVYNHLNSETYKGFPELFPQAIDIQLTNGPISKYLSSKENYSFSFKMDEAIGAMVINNGKRSFPEKTDGLWSITLTPETGPLAFYYESDNTNGSYINMLNYVIR
jgi:transglutaminase/protease-like cytokinesis protein 3